LTFLNSCFWVSLNSGAATADGGPTLAGGEVPVFGGDEAAL